MVFSGLLFLGLFLPVTLCAYYLAKSVRVRNAILLFASLFFYACGEPKLIVIMLLSAFSGFLGGRFIARSRTTAARRGALLAATAVCLGFLLVFKYAGFFADNLAVLLGTSFSFHGFALPLGISFYTFQILSYVFDVYRGEAAEQRSFFRFLLYVSMFPQLVAGPIVRYADIDREIAQRRVCTADFAYGAMRFTQGLFKKVVLANGADKLVRTLLLGDLTRLSAGAAWFGALLYTFQIYYDFSGYSDMAIGLGRLFGFHFKENFDYPYVSRSITEFWRRWHMSLGSFFRDYVYIPLGGNRRHQFANIAIVWLLTGFWHGASWNFILWGAYYGILLMLEKRWLLRAFERLPALVRILTTDAVVMFGWMLFYFTDLTQFKAFCIAAFGQNAAGTGIIAKTLAESNLPLLVLLFLCAAPLLRDAMRALSRRAKWLYDAAVPVCVTLGLFVSFCFIVTQTYNPFLYFRF